MMLFFSLGMPMGDAIDKSVKSHIRAYHTDRIMVLSIPRNAMDVGCIHICPRWKVRGGVAWDGEG